MIFSKIIPHRNSSRNFESFGWFLRNVPLRASALFAAYFLDRIMQIPNREYGIFARHISIRNTEYVPPCDIRGPLSQLSIS